MNLHYEIRICQKIYNRVTNYNKSKCLVRNSLHQTLVVYTLTRKICTQFSFNVFDMSGTFWKIVGTDSTQFFHQVFLFLTWENCLFLVQSAGFLQEPLTLKHPLSCFFLFAFMHISKQVLEFFSSTHPLCKHGLRT